MRKHGSDEVFRITGARQGLADDVRGRQRRYVISMSVRTVAVIAAASLWNVQRHVAIVALVLGAVLPYVAVVIANAGRESAPPQPQSFVPTPDAVRPVLTPGSAPDGSGEQAHTERTHPGEAHPGEAHPGAVRTRPAAETAAGDDGDRRGPRSERQYEQQ
ncbi:DUF3099 domain-containing protein [Streptomyces lavendulocolor]|uniref:DUF3099 domain-containing protein n=1 Tax=Streptomyces lavendulocolor TaxID=67316 RepID=UPI003C2AD707